MIPISALIGEHPFAQGLESDILSLIAGCARNVVLPADTYVFREGGEAGYFYLIRHGAVALEMHRPGAGAVTFLTVKSGEILGASWLLPPYRWRYDARTLKDTRAVRFDCICLRDKCEADHHVGY